MRASPSGRRRPALLPPLWIVFLVLALFLGWLGYVLLPPDESQSVRGQLPPMIDISVDKPGVQLLAVLDGSQASEGALFLTLYANSVPGGFRWLITSSDQYGGLAANGGFTTDNGPWTDQLAGTDDSRNSAVYSVLTSPLLTPDLQAALRQGVYKATAQFTVREDSVDYSVAGANFQVTLPSVEFSGGEMYPQSPTGHWVPPTGQVAVLAPDEVQTYQTDVADPFFSTTGMWTGTTEVISPYWSGTDPILVSQENRYLFVSGLLIGIAGAAFIAASQDIAERYRSRRKRKKRSFKARVPSRLKAHELQAALDQDNVDRRRPVLWHLKSLPVCGNRQSR